MFSIFNINTKTKSSSVILFYSQLWANNDQKIGSQQLITYPVCHTAFPSAYSVGEQDQEYAHGCIGNILENK